MKVSPAGNKVFFNQVVAAFTGWVESRNEYGKSVVYGDGSAIPKDCMEDLNKCMWDSASKIPWEKGSFVLVNNDNTYHARQKFQGRRYILAAVGKGIKQITESP